MEARTHDTKIQRLTSSGFIVRRSLRSAPAQKMPGEVDLRMMTRVARSNRAALKASSVRPAMFLLKEFLA